MKFQEGFVIKYLNFQIFQSPIGFSIDHTDYIVELVNEWSPTRIFRNVDTPFWSESTYKK